MSTNQTNNDTMIPNALHLKPLSVLYYSVNRAKL